MHTRRCRIPWWVWDFFNFNIYNWKIGKIPNDGRISGTGSCFRCTCCVRKKVDRCRTRRLYNMASSFLSQFIPGTVSVVLIWYQCASIFPHMPWFGDFFWACGTESQWSIRWVPVNVWIAKDHDWNQSSCTTFQLGVWCWPALGIRVPSFIFLTMTVGNICASSVPSESIKQPQTQHAARPRRLSHRKVVSYNLELEWYLYTESTHFRSGPIVCQIVRLVYSVSNTIV